MEKGYKKEKLMVEGKTKVIWTVHGNDSVVLIESKDDITAGDGAKRDLIENKGILSTTTTCNVFKHLQRKSISNHFIELYDERTFLALKLDMIPFELVIRKIATGSFLKRRPDIEEGTIFEEPVVEFFFKDDSQHDPLMIFDIVGNRVLFFDAKRPIGEGLIKEENLMDFFYQNCFPQTKQWGSRCTLNNIVKATVHLVDISRATFLCLETAWEKQNVVLIDLKIECGFDVNDINDSLLVGDVIDNDSWRIWPGGDKEQMKDKQVYRNLTEVTPEALKQLQKNYQWVAEATDKFK